MPLYEHVFLARQDISTQQVEALTGQLKSIIEAGEGSIGKVEYWGLKPITYRIKKNRKAHYTLMNIDAPHSAVAEMERQMRLNSDILRFMTLRVDELEEGPLAMMRRNTRDDRPGGRPGGPRDSRPGGPRDSRPAAPATETREAS
jgi:small subunit ribosomal protein S6